MFSIVYFIGGSTPVNVPLVVGAAAGSFTVLLIITILVVLLMKRYRYVLFQVTDNAFAKFQNKLDHLLHLLL